MHLHRATKAPNWKCSTYGALSTKLLGSYSTSAQTRDSDKQGKL